MAMNQSGIYPLEDRVLVRPDRAETRSGGGIVFTDEAIDKEQMAQVNGVVIAAGPQAFSGWDVAPRIGAKVYFAKYAGVYIHGDGEKDSYRLMNDDDILAIKGES